MMTDDDSPSTPSGAQSPAPAMAPQVQTPAAVQADFAAGPGRAVPAVAGGVTAGGDGAAGAHGADAADGTDRAVGADGADGAYCVR